MGNKFLITVDAHLLSGAAASHAVLAGMPPVASQDPVLENRRSALVDLAEELVGGSSAYSTGTAVMALMSTAGTGAALSGANRPYTILEGLGVIIVDDDDVDIGSLQNQGILGLTVTPDNDVDEPEVISATATPPPQDWHQKAVLNNLPLAGTGSDVLVGVLDTGIDASHTEFAGKTIHFAQFDGVGRNLNVSAQDAGQHGTHVCGIVGGVTCGIAPDVDLAVASVLTKPGPNGLSGTYVQIANGLNWLLTYQFRADRKGVDVINASLGGNGQAPFLQRALSNALVLMVASIGNSGRNGPNNHGSPGNYRDVVGVGATDVGNTVAAFSDWGTLSHSASYSKPDLSAPGVDIYSAIPGGQHGYKSGTSMASPVTCGVAAILLEANPTWIGRPNALKTGLLQCASGPCHPHAGGNLGGIGQVRV